MRVFRLRNYHGGQELHQPPSTTVSALERRPDRFCLNFATARDGIGRVVRHSDRLGRHGGSIPGKLANEVLKAHPPFTG